MKEKFAFVFCYFLLFSLTSAQIVIDGYVLDEKQQPVPYTSVYDSLNKKGTITDIKGFFSMEVMEEPVILNFSNVSYNKLRKKIEQTDDIIIILSQKITRLDEVIVNASNSKSKYIGSPKNKRGINSFEADKPFFQLGLKIENIESQLYKQANLVSINIKIVSALIGGIKPDGTNQLRLRIYSIDEDGGVGEGILDKNEFLTPSKSGWYQLKLKSPFLLPEEGFFIALEWLKDLDIEEWKSKKYTFQPTYGLSLWGHTFKDNEDELNYYSTWRYDPDENKWEKDTRFPNSVFIIPTFRLEIKEYE